MQIIARNRGHGPRFVFSSRPGFYVSVFFSVCFLLITLAGNLSALEVGGFFRFGNLYFHPDRGQADGFSGLDPTFYGSGFLEHDFQFHDMRFETEYVYDSVLQNILISRFVNKWDIFSFGVGPFLGLFNNPEKLWLPKLGISAFFRFEWPGIMFFEMRIDNSTFDQLEEEGDYLQERNNFSLGFYVPYAICSFNVLSRQFVQREDGLDVKAAITEYSFTTDIYKKNVPYKVLITFAYLDQSKEFGSSGPEHSLGSIILGLRLDINVTDFLTLIIDTENSIYTFGYNELLSEDIAGWAGYLFKADMGFSLDVTRIVKKAKGNKAN